MRDQHIKNSPVMKDHKKFENRKDINTTRENCSFLDQKIPSKFKKERKTSIHKSILETEEESNVKIIELVQPGKEEEVAVNNDIKIEIKDMLELLFIYNEKSIHLNQKSLVSSTDNQASMISKIVKTAIDQITRIEFT